MASLPFPLKMATPKGILQPDEIAESALLGLAMSRFHTSARRNDLMEFFDDKANWGADEIRVGRPWKLDELRIKSNQDLHKLWALAAVQQIFGMITKNFALHPAVNGYVLIKERNMLLTMEAEYERQRELFPNPERIFKVEESMENIMTVTKERDIAYNMLETGKTGEPEPYVVINFLGLRESKTPEEHHVPAHLNKRYQTLYPNKTEKWQKKYLSLYAEQQRKKAKNERRKQQKLYEKIMENDPTLTEEDLKEMDLSYVEQ